MNMFILKVPKVKTDDKPSQDETTTTTNSAKGDTNQSQASESGKSSDTKPLGVKEPKDDKHEEESGDKKSSDTKPLEDKDPKDGKNKEESETGSESEEIPQHTKPLIVTIESLFRGINPRKTKNDTENGGDVSAENSEFEDFLRCAAKRPRAGFDGCNSDDEVEILRKMDTIDSDDSYGSFCDSLTNGKKDDFGAIYSTNKTKEEDDSSTRRKKKNQLMKKLFQLDMNVSQKITENIEKDVMKKNKIEDLGKWRSKDNMGQAISRESLQKTSHQWGCSYDLPSPIIEGFCAGKQNNLPIQEGEHLHELCMTELLELLQENPFVDVKEMVRGPTLFINSMGQVYETDLLLPGLRKNLKRAEVWGTNTSRLDTPLNATIQLKNVLEKKLGKQYDLKVTVKGVMVPSTPHADVHTYLARGYFPGEFIPEVVGVECVTVGSQREHFISDLQAAGFGILNDCSLVYKPPLYERQSKCEKESLFAWLHIDTGLVNPLTDCGFAMPPGTIFRFREVFAKFGPHLADGQIYGFMMRTMFCDPPKAYILCGAGRHIGASQFQRIQEQTNRIKDQYPHIAEIMMGIAVEAQLFAAMKAHLGGDLVDLYFKAINKFMPLAARYYRALQVDDMERIKFDFVSDICDWICINKTSNDELPVGGTLEETKKEFLKIFHGVCMLTNGLTANIMGWRRVMERLQYGN